jgi:RIO kinase 1
MKDNNRVQKIFSEERTKKVFQKVFDENAVRVLHNLAGKGYFDHLEFTISTGKEAHVFRAVDKSGNFVAVKIYKIITSDFKQMQDYLRFEKRFKNIRNDKRKIVFAWTQKEFSYLQRMQAFGVPSPTPIIAKDNVLVMEFIGEKGNASPQLKDTRVKNAQKLYDQLADAMANMLDGKMIHADLSDYNILIRKNEPVVIDCGQVIPTTHPNAKTFYERDVRNMVKVFKRLGIENVSFDSLYEDVKEKLKEKTSSPN